MPVTDKRLDFDPANSAFHPVTAVGRNQSTNLNQQLLGTLNTQSRLLCTDCHNSDDFSTTSGAVTDSPATVSGPHGGTHRAILRANYRRQLTAGSFNAGNFSLCFRCHDQNALTARRREDGSRTNFYDTDRDESLHWVHLIDRIDKTEAVCKNCHYNVHSNENLLTTDYRINGTTYVGAAAAGTAGYKTRLVAFSPDIGGLDGAPRAHDGSSYRRGDHHPHQPVLRAVNQGRRAPHHRISPAHPSASRWR